MTKPAVRAPKTKPKRSRYLAIASLLLVVFLLLIDQLGVRELSGRDFPITDPFAGSLHAHVLELAKPAWNGRVPGSEGNVAAARYLEDALKAAGVGPSHFPIRAFLATVVMLFGMGGCTWSPFGLSKDKGDAGTVDAAPELEHCTLKAQACGNSCLDMGPGCAQCCRRNAAACDRGESYKFYACPDE